MNAPYVKSNKWSEAMAMLASPTVSTVRYPLFPGVPIHFRYLRLNDQISSSVFYYFSAFYFNPFLMCSLFTEQACFKPAANFFQLLQL
jgi:hypothetical protein